MRKRTGLAEMAVRGTIAALLVVAVFAVYFPVRHHDFVGYDDFPYIVENPTVRGELNASNLRAPPPPGLIPP